MAITRQGGSYHLRSRRVSKYSPDLRNSGGKVVNSDTRVYIPRRRIRYGGGAGRVKRSVAKSKVKKNRKKKPKKLFFGEEPIDFSDKEYGQQCISCADTALKAFNELSSQKGGQAYEMTKYGDSVGFMNHSSGGFLYHCNFLAKSKNSSSESEQPKLFFAEILTPYCKARQLSNNKNSCCILGPADSVSWDVHGCKACADSVPIFHPLDGFSVGYTRHLIDPNHKPKPRGS